MSKKYVGGLFKGESVLRCEQKETEITDTETLRSAGV